MRASRLLHILLLLQNRGRLTAGQLADELEVAHRTILRDMDALTEAGLPIVTYQGNRGGFELGFNYRTRLTGLAVDEAEALGVLLADPSPLLGPLGLTAAARRATSKLLESLPDPVRQASMRAQGWFLSTARPVVPPDPRIEALADAIRNRFTVRLDARSARPREVQPIALLFAADGWQLVDARTPDTPIPAGDWHDINISATRFG